MQLSAGFRLADLYQVAIWVSQEAANLGAPVMRRGEERGAPGPQRLIGCLAVSHTQRHRVTDPIGVSGRLEDHGGLVGGRAAPPLTSKSQVPANRSTTLVPPYSRYSSAPSTPTQKSRDRAGSVTTRMWVTATSVPSGLDGGCRFTMILPHAPHRLAVTRAVGSLPKPGRFVAWPERGWPFGPAIVADWRCRPG